MSATIGKGASRASEAAVDVDAIVVGAGFGGVRALYEMRRLGLSVACFEAGSDVGGTWYWNRYPGARTDSESWSYCFFFSKALMQDWDWDERMPGWQQVQRYISYTVDRFDLRRSIQFNTRLEGADYDAAGNRWLLRFDDGETRSCRYFISAVGWFAVPCQPKFPGLERFKGEWYLSSRWPKEPVDFTGKRVGLVGTGATGVQIIPAVAKLAKHLTVFQRTPNYVLPSRNFKLQDEDRAEIKANYDTLVAQIRKQVFAFAMNDSTLTYDDVDEAERQRVFERGWETGGFRFLFETFGDITIDPRTNEAACEFVRNKIRSIVHDPAIAEKLCPHYAIALKRPPLCNFYYETFNRPNVTLVDVSQAPITEILPDGIRVGDQVYELDVIIFAIGFDAVTGPLTQLDIRGVSGETIRDKWAAGPRTHFGICMDDFPNLFIVTGPQAPFSNVPPVIESAVAWIGEAIEYMRKHGHARMEATPEAVEGWVQLMQTMIDATLLRHAPSQRSWYMGANIPGKAVTPLFYFGGAGPYFEEVQRCADSGFPGYRFTGAERLAEAGAG